MTVLDTKKVSFLTLGCAKNEVDSAHMATKLARAGYEIIEWEEVIANKATAESLDAIIVNTCSFIQEATEESLDSIFEVAGFPYVANGKTKLVVSGCLPSRYSGDLQEELQEAQLFVPCKEEDAIVEKLDGLFGIERSQKPQSTTLAHQNNVQDTTSASAYVKISDGCNRFCSYCAIPYIRGRYHSFTYETISSEIEGLVQQGVKEIVLIAQDTGIWGSDLEPKLSLAWLLDNLAATYTQTWFRVLYIQPEYVDEALLQVMAAHENICNYLDIPFQHVNENLLKSMNRKGSEESFLTLIGLIRNYLPDAALRTTFIVGYPGETEEQFDQLVNFVSEADLDYVGIFAYSPEEGTRAATLPNQIDEEIKQDRLRELRDIADTVSSTQLSRFIGQKLDVLVLGEEEDGQLFGRSKYQAPDVDGVTYLDGGKIGNIAHVRIEDTLYYEMEGVCEQ